MWPMNLNILHKAIYQNLFPSLSEKLTNLKRTLCLTTAHWRDYSQQPTLISPGNRKQSKRWRFTRWKVQIFIDLKSGAFLSVLKWIINVPLCYQCNMNSIMYPCMYMKLIFLISKQKIGVNHWRYPCGSVSIIHLHCMRVLLFVILIVMEVIWFSYATYPEETAIFTLTFSVTEQRRVRVGGVGCTQSYWLHGTYFFGLSCTLH